MNPNGLRLLVKQTRQNSTVGKQQQYTCTNMKKNTHLGNGLRLHGETKSSELYSRKPTIIHSYQYVKNIHLGNGLRLHGETNSSELYSWKPTTIHLYQYVKNAHLGNGLRLHGARSSLQLYIWKTTHTNKKK